MSYTITNVKDELSGILHGTTLNKITNLNNVFNRAARDLLLDIDPAQTRRVQTITNALYDQVYNYAVPTDLKSDHVIQIRLNGDPTDEEVGHFNKVHEKYFELNKKDYEFDVQMNSGVKFIRIARESGKTININKVDSIGNEGAWSVGGDASNLLLDDINYVSGLASLKYDLSGVTGSAYIENTTMSEVDLSDYENVGSIFLWVYIPNTSRITSYNLIWGTDTTANYWNKTVTTPHFGSFVTGWNLLRFDWDSATKVGSPDSTLVNSLKLTTTYTVGTAILNNRLDNVNAKYGRYYEMPYYSEYLFQSSAGTWKLETDDDDDIVNLGTENYNLFIYKCAEHAFLQTTDDKNESAVYANKYNMELNKYERQNKSEKEKTIQSYYKL